MDKSLTARAASPVPRFFLYGEPPHLARAGFVHVESIPDRSRLHDWKIRPHAHGDLHQLLLVTGGRGEMRVESGREPFASPTLLVLPAGLIHGFDFAPDTAGYVITLAAGTLEELLPRERALQSVFERARCLPLASLTDAPELELAAHLLRRELLWDAPGRGIAAEARLVTLLVGVLRALREPAVGAQLGPRAALVSRFRDLLDRQFRREHSVAHYARQLAVSESRLRTACVALTGKPPLKLLHERVLLEAKRTLSYSELSVGQTAYALGFSDPAYFSRFFRARIGMSPAAFRRRTSGTSVSGL